MCIFCIKINSDIAIEQINDYYDLLVVKIIVCNKRTYHSNHIVESTYLFLLYLFYFLILLPFNETKVDSNNNSFNLNNPVFTPGWRVNNKFSYILNLPLGPRLFILGPTCTNIWAINIWYINIILSQTMSRYLEAVNFPLGPTSHTLYDTCTVSTDTE